MIRTIVEQARSERMLNVDPAWQFNARIRLNRILVDVFDEQGAYYHLRVAETYDLEPEYAIAQRTAAALGDRVVPVHGFFRAAETSVIVYQGIEARCPQPAALLRAVPDSDEARQLVEFLGSMAMAFGVESVADDLENWVQVIEARDWTRQDRSVVLHAIASARANQALLRRASSQHGDLVVNNLGYRTGGLVVYDWEDFDRVRLAGFDLAVLVASAAGFDPAILSSFKGGGEACSRHVPWISDACAVLGMTVADFLATLPFHLLVFLVLKDRYSATIRRKALEAARSLL